MVRSVRDHGWSPATSRSPLSTASTFHLPWRWERVEGEGVGAEEGEQVGVGFGGEHVAEELGGAFAEDGGGDGGELRLGDVAGDAEFVQEGTGGGVENFLDAAGEGSDGIADDGDVGAFEFVF